MSKESFSSSEFFSQEHWLWIVGYQNREELSFWHWYLKANVRDKKQLEINSLDSDSLQVLGQ